MIVRQIGTIQDVTTTRLAEERLRQAQKMEIVGQITGGVAHDFNNLLGIIIGNLDFLEEGLRENENLASMIKSATDAALRAAELTRHLLAFARQQPLTRKVTDVNPDISEYAWGTSELVEWRSIDGTKLQGVVIKPGNYEPGKRYPVLVYYYELFSQRLHEFNQPAVNHRPSFPVYASDGYVVFLPDVRFEIGRPGYSATKAVVPGVQHLIDIGLADPDAIALHGHSWSGYQTAHVVTQSNIFKTAIAGAPVGNMTSAYSGIRWGSGLARQFQYEQGQSRLSGSLWEARDEYIENSPVFFADRINTPLLLIHGDKDDAVPWYQSIELYLALRRLGKETVFLQYRDEPHHPQKYANKLDWAVKMKEWLDHYLKGAPAAPWISEGIPYSGR